jgi:hypothetical protein
MRDLPFILMVPVFLLSCVACYQQHQIYRMIKESGSSELPYTPFWLRFPAALGCYPPFLKFIYHKRYKRIGDPRLDRLCAVFSATFCAMVVIFGALIISILTK